MEKQDEPASQTSDLVLCFHVGDQCSPRRTWRRLGLDSFAVAAAARTRRTGRSLILPNPDGSVLQSGDTPGDHCTDLQRGRGHARGFDCRIPARRCPGSRGGSALHAVRAVHAHRRQSSARAPGRDMLRMWRLHGSCALLQRHGLWVEALQLGECRDACRAGRLCGCAARLVVSGDL